MAFVDLGGGGTVNEDIEKLNEKILENKNEIRQLNETTSIINNATGQTIQLTDSSDNLIKNMVVNTNLFDVSTVVSGIIASDGKQYANSTFVVGDYMKVLPNEKICVSETQSISFQFRFAYYDENKTFIKIANLDNSASGVRSATTTTPNNAKYFRLYYSINAGGATVDRKDIQVEYGNTPTAYKSYAETVDVTVCGKNLADPTIVRQPNGTTVSDDDTITVKNTWSWILYPETKRINLQPGVYYFKIFDYSDSVNGYARLSTDTSYVRKVALNGGNTQFVITVTNPCSFFMLFVANAGVEMHAKISLSKIGYLSEHEKYQGQTATIDVSNQKGWEDLHTYKGTTNIIPSVTADMSVDYVADTKLYVDNKINEIANAIVATAE